MQAVLLAAFPFNVLKSVGVRYKSTTARAIWPQEHLCYRCVVYVGGMRVCACGCVHVLGGGDLCDGELDSVPQPYLHTVVRPA